MRLLPFEYGVRNLGRSPLRLALTVLGSAVVVLLVLGAGAFVRGMDSSLGASGGEHNVILLGAGSEESVERSEIGANVAGLVAASVRGVKGRFGVAYVSPEVHIAMAVTEEASSSRPLMAMLRGVTPAALLVHDQAQISEGRLPRPGADELLVGAMAAEKLGLPPARLGVGRTLHMDGRPWTIVGRFIAPRTVMEAEIWCPLPDLKIVAKRDSDSCVILTLEGAEFADIDAFAKSRLDLELVAMRETDYYAKLTAFYRPIKIVAWATAVLIGIGGLFGGLNTMYAAFASRVRELGMLQTLGFTRPAIVASLVQESLVATAAGALVACAAGLLFLDGVAVRFSMGAFGLAVDAPVVLLGLAAGLALGLVGALPPAWRCLRLSIPESLKMS